MLFIAHAVLCRETTMEFMKTLPPVVDRILSLFALGIGFPEDFFKKVKTLRVNCCLVAVWEIIAKNYGI